MTAARMKPIVLDSQEAGRRGAEWFLPSSRRQLLLRRWALRLMRLPGVDRWAHDKPARQRGPATVSNL